MRRPIIFVMLAGVAALVAAMVVYSALKKREAMVEEAMVKSVNIVVAAKDLAIGSKLDPSSVKLVRWSREDLPPGAYTDPGPLMNQYTKTSFVTNEPIVGDRLFSGDKNAGVLPLLIPSGMRAVSVPVDEVADLSGFVLPHSRVDLLVSVANSADNNQPFSKIVLQNVEVLAVAQEVENTTADKPEIVHVVTLLVTPEQAERVVLATHEGPLRLAMRNYSDNRIVETEGVDMGTLLRTSPAAPVIQPQQAVAPIIHHYARPKPVQIEIMRNGKSVENVSFVHNHGGTSSDSGASDASQGSGGDNSAPAAGGESGVGTESDGSGGATVSGSSPSAMSEGLAPVAAMGNHPATVPVTASETGPGGAGFTTSHSKTIDIP